MKWSDIGITYTDKKPITLKNSVIDVLKTCKNRFVLIPLGFSWNVKNIAYGHANTIIYDTKTKEVERFEPHGISGSNILLNMGEQFDTMFPKMLIDAGIPVSKYYKPLDFCPRYSFQALETPQDKLAGDPAGFCQSWSIWYADLRFANPDVPREDVIQIAIRKLKDDPRGFKRFIRNYAMFITKLTIQIPGCLSCTLSHFLSHSKQV
jgi:hypothetical protein